MYSQMLAAITDEPISGPPPEPDAGEVSTEDVDRGFGESLSHPEQYSQGSDPPPLPPAGPLRARAALIEPRASHLSRKGRAMVRLRCPPAWPEGLAESCKGKAKLSRSSSKFDYEIRAGEKQVLRFELRKKLRGRIEKGKEVTVTARTANRDQAGGTKAKLDLVLAE
jgi:hypothetical protein